MILLWMGLILVHVFAILFLAAVICGNQAYDRLDDRSVMASRERGIYTAEFEWAVRSYTSHFDLMNREPRYAIQFLPKLTEKAGPDARRLGAGLGRRVFLSVLLGPLVFGIRLSEWSVLRNRAGGLLAWPAWRQAIIGLVLFSPHSAEATSLGDQ